MTPYITCGIHDASMYDEKKNALYVFFYEVTHLLSYTERFRINGFDYSFITDIRLKHSK